MRSGAVSSLLVFLGGRVKNSSFVVKTKHYYLIIVESKLIG